ncbi:MAG: hypothetical protein LBE75_05035 [Burkholderiales bacterium]|nr:hypothetical protein [Burkholderiales bacterium]
MKYATDFSFVQKHLADPPYWSSERILSWSDVYNRTAESFISHSYWTETGSLNVFRVVGTDHPDYIGKTWLEFLQKGKRMSNNLRLLEKNPDYYLEPYKRNPRMVFTTLDGLNYYVSSDGIHRTCLARFFLFERDMSQLHDLTISHYKVDELFLETYLRLFELVRSLRLHVDLSPEKTALSREDTAGWKIDSFETCLVWRDDNGVSRFSKDDAVEKRLELEIKALDAGDKASRIRNYFLRQEEPS